MANGFVVYVFMLAVVEITSASITSQDSEILSIIKELQEKVNGQEKQIRSLQSHITTQDCKISSIQEQGKRQNGLINTLLKQLHGEPISNMSDFNMADIGKHHEIQPEKHGSIDKLRDQAQQQDQQGSTQPKRRLVNEQETVAFQAVVSADTIDHIGIHEKIVFDSVHLNIGGDYNNVNGIFIAPRAGIYLFSTSVLAEPNGSLDVNIVRNGTPLAGAFANTEGKLWYDQGSVTVAVKLNAGDNVWVENTWPADAQLHGHGSHTSFTGVLVMGI